MAAVKFVVGTVGIGEHLSCLSDIIICVATATASPTNSCPESSKSEEQKKVLIGLPNIQIFIHNITNLLMI